MVGKRQLSRIPLLIVTLVSAATAQVIQVSPTNRTVEVNATETVEVSPEVAVIRIGYENFASTKEQAYDDNVRNANKITKSLLDAGVSDEVIQTQTLRLDRVDADESWPADMIAEHRYFAQQSWNIRIPVSQVQAVVELAVRSGANDVSDIDWQVKDPMALEIKAGLAALEKARTVALKMADAQGATLGQLLYLSNSYTAPRYARGPNFAVVNTSTSRVRPPTPQLKLFPKKVSKEATVHVVFSME